jgi:hypothetical protein
MVIPPRTVSASADCRRQARCWPLKIAMQRVQAEARILAQFGFDAAVDIGKRLLAEVQLKISDL